MLTTYLKGAVQTHLWQFSFSCFHRKFQKSQFGGNCLQICQRFLQTVPFCGGIWCHHQGAESVLCQCGTSRLHAWLACMCGNTCPGGLGKRQGLSVAEERRQESTDTEKEARHGLRLFGSDASQTGWPRATDPHVWSHRRGGKNWHLPSTWKRQCCEKCGRGFYVVWGHFNGCWLFFLFFFLPDCF